MWIEPASVSPRRTNPVQGRSGPGWFVAPELKRVLPSQPIREPTPRSLATNRLLGQTNPISARVGATQISKRLGFASQKSLSPTAPKEPKLGSLGDRPAAEHVSGSCVPGQPGRELMARAASWGFQRLWLLERPAGRHGRRSLEFFVHRNDGMGVVGSAPSATSHGFVAAPLSPGPVISTG